jgi:hypothetical protein
VIVAFLLFGLLQSLNHIFDAGADFIGATRLVTQARVSFTQPMPLSMLPKLEAVPAWRASRTCSGSAACGRKTRRCSCSRSIRSASTTSTRNG